MIVLFKYNTGEIRFHEVPEPLPFVWRMFKPHEIFITTKRESDIEMQEYIQVFHLEELILTGNPIYVEDKIIT